ncbi:MAG: AraC family transcriptional regulator [Flavobacteriaceae bacterium]|jgi:AraC-like DNA-binding protein|nr:AraC family transcriptional regulator [Flavobacteriaceae bacterium]
MEEIAILQINDLAHNNLQTDFYANTIPLHLKDNHNHIEKPHKHNFYVSMIFTQGTGIHEIDFKKHHIKPGSVFTLAPGQTHSWNLSEDIDGYIFYHSQEFLDLHFVRDTIREYPIFRSIFYPNVVYLHEKDIKEIAYIFLKMMEEIAQDKWKSHQMLVNLTSQFYILTNRLLMLEESFNKIINSQYSNHFMRFEDLLEEHYKKEKSAAAYAEALNMTQKHLNRICKTMINQTTTDLIINRVLLEAKRMLIYTDKNFNEIAIALGYEDYSYFSKIFKRKVGETPKDFLKKYN